MSVEEVDLIVQVQKLIEQQLGSFAQELAAIDEFSQQFKPQPQMPPDTSLQVAQMGAQVQGQLAQMRAQVDQAKLQQQGQIDQAKLQLEQAKLQQGMQTKQAELEAKQRDQEARMQSELFRQQQESMRSAEEIAARERMNTADNDTAKLLAAAEMATGEKVAVSTGTGINPNP